LKVLRFQTNPSIFASAFAKGKAPKKPVLQLYFAKELTAFAAFFLLRSNFFNRRCNVSGKYPVKSAETIHSN